MNRIVIRGSSLAVRAFAVAVLVIGVGTAYYATSNKDSRTVAVEQKTPVVDERLDQPSTLADAKRAGSTAQIDAQKKAAAAAAKAAADRAAAAARAARSKARTEGGTGDPADNVDVPTTPIDCMRYSGNRRIGCSMLSTAGFPSSQMACLEPLWTKESGWSTHATNSAGTAWGIPQALPGSKMKSAGPNWRDDAATQIKWGFGYIKGRYGTPCKAWAHFKSNNWY